MLYVYIIQIPCEKESGWREIFLSTSKPLTLCTVISETQLFVGMVVENA